MKVDRSSGTYFRDSNKRPIMHPNLYLYQGEAANVQYPFLLIAQEKIIQFIRLAFLENSHFRNSVPDVYHFRSAFSLKLLFSKC
jgi:hypothetical protein